MVTKSHWSTFLSTWFGLGQLSKAPGTIGTLGAIPLVFSFSYLGPIGYMVATFLFILFSIFVCQVDELVRAQHDSSEVVIDEVAGFLVTMTWLPFTWQSFVVGFVVFRLFDILKPPPIAYIDKKVEGGLGIVADDLAAGLISNVILQVIFTNTSWLGRQMQDGLFPLM